MKKPEKKNCLRNLDSLKDMFPSVEEAEIISKAEKIPDINALADELSTLEIKKKGNDGLPYSSEANCIGEIFPNISKERLLGILVERDGNVESLINYLLEQDLRLYSKRRPASRQMKNGQDNNGDQGVWFLLKQKAQELGKFLGIPEEVASSSLHKNSGLIPKAVVEIIKNHKLASQHKPSRPHGIPLGGRVQGPQMARRDKKEVANNASKQQRPYVYDDNSPEAKEIKSIYFSNVELREIDDGFIQKTLTFFRGDIPKSIEVFYYLIETNSTYLTTNGRIRSRTPALVPQIGHVSYPTTRRTGILLESAWSPSSSNSSSILKVTDAHNSILDLHNLTIDQALKTTQAALEEWWTFEEKERIIAGTFNRFGSKALFIEPLTVITGRGLHSSSGKPRLRTAIKKYLMQNKFVFSEQLSSFIVEGRLKR